MKPQTITQKYLKKVLNYDKCTGVFTWINPRSTNVYKGDVAGHRRKDGRVSITVNNKAYYANRLAFLYVEGYLPENPVDHIDTNPENDRWDNLREVSPACNSRNCKISKNNKSGVNGVYFEKSKNKWRAKISVKSITVSLGSFSDIKEAVMARHEAEIKHNYPACQTTSSAFLYLQKQSSE